MRYEVFTALNVSMLILSVSTTCNNGDINQGSDKYTASIFRVHSRFLYSSSNILSYHITMNEELIGRRMRDSHILASHLMTFFQTVRN